MFTLSGDLCWRVHSGKKTAIFERLLGNREDLRCLQCVHEMICINIVNLSNNYQSVNDMPLNERETFITQTL